MNCGSVKFGKDVGEANNRGLQEELQWLARR